MKTTSQECKCHFDDNGCHNIQKEIQSISGIFENKNESTVELQNALLNNGELHRIMIEFEDELGVICINDINIHEAPPLGYEDCEDSITKYVDRKLTIQYYHEENIVYTLNAIQIYPEQYQHDIQILYIIDDDGNECVFPLQLDSTTTTLIVRFIFPIYFTGNLNNIWMIFHMKSTLQNNIISNTYSTFCIGINIKGSVYKRKKIALSIEARPFIFQTMRQLFDSPVQYTFGVKGLPEWVIHPPRNVSLIIHSVRMKYLLDPSYIQYYFESLRLNDFATLHLQMKETLPAINSYNMRNRYISLLKNCLWMEEAHMLYDISQYDLHYIKLTQESNTSNIQTLFKKHDDTTLDESFTCKMVIQGSNENRPKISQGDFIRLRPVEEDLPGLSSRFLMLAIRSFELIGIVQTYHLIGEKAIVIFKLPNGLKELIPTLRFHVRFTFERCGLCFAHEALDILRDDEFLKDRLFPDVHDYSEKPPEFPVLGKKAVENEELPPLIYPINDTSASSLNPAQTNAIQHVVAACKQSCSPSFPYMIFGPPGTGKTRVIIAAILEVNKQNPYKRILAVAPSDAAADVILSRLAKHLKPTELFRLHWWQRSLTSVPIETLKHCKLEGKALFEVPTFHDISKFQVIVTTCGVAGVLRHLKNGRKSLNNIELIMDFDVVIIDEAAQATEAESIIALSLCKKDGVVILAGDTQQLGPTYRSPAYRDRELFSSLQERLISTHPYKFLQMEMKKDDEEHIFDDFLQSFSKVSGAPVMNRSANKLGTFLYQNYRSNKHIFEVSSRLLYSNSLKQCGKEEEVNALVKWSYLPKDKDFPVHVVGIDGIQQHLIDSPSYYNIQEGEAVVDVCASLLRDEGIKGKFQASEIGVIAAFRAQVLKIRELLRERNLRDVSVGSVEDFQGQEKKVIIISTVLTSLPPLEDREYIGLFHDHRRFNVAITRAISLCVVIGHPHALYQDHYFKLFLQFVDKHKSYRGYESLALTKELLDRRSQGKADSSSSLALGDGVRTGHYTDSQEWRVML